MAFIIWVAAYLVTLVLSYLLARVIVKDSFRASTAEITVVVFIPFLNIGILTLLFLLTKLEDCDANTLRKKFYKFDD